MTSILPPEDPEGSNIEPALDPAESGSIEGGSHDLSEGESELSDGALMTPESAEEEKAVTVSDQLPPVESREETTPGEGDDEERLQQKVQACVLKLQRTICALPEPAGHPNAVAREFFRWGPQVSVEALHRFHEGLVDTQARGAYMGVLRLFISPKELPYHLKQPMYAYARKQGYVSISHCFLRPPAQRKRGTGECLSPEPPESDKTLGERRTLARSLDRLVITRVRRDPDPMVVRNLLKNPRLKEEDVIRIASSRPVRAQVLVDISQHRTWLNAPKVQLTLALNPYTPTYITMALLPLLNLKDLREMSGDHKLHVVVREASEYLVSIRTSHRRGR
jgi:hypothetical protein